MRLGMGGVRIRIAGRVSGFAIAMLLAVGLAAPAWGDNDIVHFGSSISVGPGETAHDLVCFLCSVTVHGEATGDVVAFFGDVRLDGKADKDVVNFFGRTTASDGSAIGKDVVNFFGGIQLGKGVTIGKDAVAMFGGFDADESAEVGGSRVRFPGAVFWVPFLLIVGGIGFAISEFRRGRRTRYLRGY
jgi:hypothetical protein